MDRVALSAWNTQLSGTIAGNKAERGAYAAMPIENNIFILLFKFTCIKISIWPNLSLT